MAVATVQFGSGALAALVAVLVTVVVLALIVTRIVKRDVRVKVAEIGVFVRRERLGDVPPVTPPDELAPAEDVDEATAEWPIREGP